VGKGKQDWRVLPLVGRKRGEDARGGDKAKGEVKHRRKRIKTSQGLKRKIRKL
jgi:hypothetical protein